MNEINLNNISIIKSSLKNIDNGTTTLNSSTKHVSISKGPNNENNLNNHNKKTSRIKKSSSTLNELGKIPFYPASTQLSQSSKSFKKTIAENNLVPYENEKSTLYSTWTPLSDEKSNQKLFEERKQLFTKWFETWNDSQRRIAIEEILSISKPKQLIYTREILDKVSPVYHIDFTRILPRVLCLYIMSFLDPRSLCRSSQVCWYWKMLSESDQLWIPKCTRFGWNLNYIPTSFENGIWKQFYIENTRAILYPPVKKQSVQTPISTERSEFINRSLHDLSYGRFGFNQFVKNGRSVKSKNSAPLKQPPWRGNNPRPNHFYRYNYLDEDDVPANTLGPNEKRRERLIKTLIMDSSLKKTALNSLTTANKDDLTLTKEQQIEHELQKNLQNQSNLEEMISKGQNLINQINSMDSEFKATGLFDANKSPNLFISNKNTSLSNNAINDIQKKPPLQAWTLIEKNNGGESS